MLKLSNDDDHAAGAAPAGRFIMASRRLAVTAVNADILSDEDIRIVEVPSVVSVSVSSVTNGDEFGLRLNKTIIMDAGEVNTVAADLIDAYADRMVFNSVVGPGQLKAPVPTLTTELQALFSVEPILPGMQAGF